MAIRDLQKSLVEVGRIRLGQKVTASNGKTRPAKLETLRFTSQAHHLIEEIAALYGGEAKSWAGGRGQQFEVITDARLVDVYVPPQRIDPFYEQWGNGVCTRRCDGERDLVRDVPCVCSPEKRDCKPTTNINLMLSDVPGLGVWRLTSHGFYAASELSSLASLVLAAPMPIPGRLLVESRQRKFFNRAENKVETRDYFVPVVLIDSVTSRQVHIGGDALTQAIQMSNSATAAVEAAPAARAIEAGPAVPAGPDPAVIERGLKAIGSATPDQMDDLHERIKKMGSPQVLLDAFQTRLGELAVADAAREAREAEAVEAADRAQDASDEQAAKELQAAWKANATDGPATGTGELDAATTADASTDDGDRGAAMMELLGVAGKLKINTKQLEAEIEGREGVSRTQATAAQLRKVTAFLLERGK